MTLRLWMQLVPIPLLIACAAAVVCARPARASDTGAPDKVTFFGPEQSPISSGVSIPAGRAFLWTSGTVPSLADTAAAEGTRARYGDTKIQARSILSKFEAALKDRGLSFKDVVYLRAYVVADPEKGNKPDYPGWFEAYGEKFGTKDNPVKTARSTVAVAGLVNAGWLIEIEAFAVYP